MRLQFKELFYKDLPNKIHFKQVGGITSLKRRKIAYKKKFQLVDTEPHCTSKYPWVENYYKQETKANLGRAMLPLIILECLRPFSVKALDFL